MTEASVGACGRDDCWLCTWAPVLTNATHTAASGSVRPAPIGDRCMVDGSSSGAMPTRSVPGALPSSTGAVETINRLSTHLALLTDKLPLML